MGEILEIKQEPQLNPYVSQVSKLSKALHYLAGVFEKTEIDNAVYTIQDVELMSEYLEKTYPNIATQEGQWPEISKKRWTQLCLQVIRDIDEYGAEMSIEKRRELEKEFYYYKEICEYIQEKLMQLKQKQILRDKIREGKQGSMYALHAFAKAVEESALELDKSIFEDERTQKRIKGLIKRVGVRALKVTVMVSENGRYEIQLTAKAKAGTCVTTKQIADIISQAMGREFLPEIRERFVIKEQYTTLIFVEKPSYYTLHGMAKIEKEKSKISGDNFLVMDIPGGKKGILLSDGMGSGEEAYWVSKGILEMAEVLLEAGVSAQLCVDIINALVTSNNDTIKFGTLDMSIIDIYTGNMEMVKAGAASTYIIHRNSLVTCAPTSLPLGVLNQINTNHFKGDLTDETFIVMLTDGVTEVIEEADKGAYIQKIINESKSRNPKELAQTILDKVLEKEGGHAIDDMLVLVIGVWEMGS